MSINNPSEVLKIVYTIGISKVNCSDNNFDRLAILSILAGIYIAMGATLSVVIGFGLPELTANNPGLQKLLSGAAFPLGLILVIFLGAELFTGNNALLIPAFLQKKYSALSVARNWALVYFGNIIGGAIFVGMVYTTTSITKQSKTN